MYVNLSQILTVKLGVLLNLARFLGINLNYYIEIINDRMNCRNRKKLSGGEDGGESN